MFQLLADSGPIVHVAPLEVFKLGGLSVTNSILYGWACSLALVGVMVWAARRATIKPQGGLVQYVEAGVSFIADLVENAFDDKKIGRKYVPFFVTLFFFVLVNNLLGILPIVGEGFKVGQNPLLRPFTGDLNGTLAIGLVTMIVVYVASVKEAGGLFKYLRHFFIGSPKNPMYLLIGILEMITDLTRVLSLSLRLFLNITIGEIMIAVFAYLGHVAAPITALPFTLLDIFVAVLQAYIFTILPTMYLAIAVNSAGHAHGNNDIDLTDGELPETIDAKASGVAA